MKSDIPKQYLLIHGKPLACHSFEAFLSAPSVREIIVVCSAEYQELFTTYLSHKPLRFASPGFRRQDSCFQGLLQVSEEASHVCFHDAARALISEEIIEKVIKEAFEHGAASAAMPLKGTIKQIDARGFVAQTLDRTHVWEAQTPQVAPKKWFEEGYAYVQAHDLHVTDDMSVIELTGRRAKLVTGCYSNIKITTPEDLIIAEQLLSRVHKIF